MYGDVPSLECYIGDEGRWAPSRYRLGWGGGDGELEWVMWLAFAGQSAMSCSLLRLKL